MAVTYLRLFPATTQFVMKNGMLNVAGLLHIYLEGTDDVAPVFDTDGSQLQQPVMLDNDGRARGLFVDASKVYWMKVCDRDDGQIYTVRKMVPSGGGAGSALGKSYSVISSDGTVDVTEFDNNGTTVFDLSCDIENEVSKWGSSVGLRSVIDGDDTWAEVNVISTTGSVTYNNGWVATKDCLGDIAASIEMSGHDASAISTIDTKMVVTVDGTEIFSETGLLDPTENAGRCSFEWKGELSEGQKVDARIYVKCVQGINLGLVGRVFYNEECDGVVGGDGTSYIPGTGIDITRDVISVTGMATQSAFDACCSSMSGAVSSLQVDVSAISGTVSSLQVDVSAISAAVSGVTGQTGNYVEKSSISAESSVWNTVSGKQDSGNYLSATDSALFQPAGNYLSSTDSALFQPVTGMSAYVDTATFEDCCSSMSGAVSSLSSDVSAISGAVSGLTGQYVEISAISAQSSVWDSASAIPYKLDESAFTSYTSTAGQFTGVTTDGTLTGNGTTGSALGLNGMDLEFDSSMNTSVVGNTATVGVNTAILSSYAYQSSLSSKLDESAFTAYTSTAGQFSGVTTDATLTGNGTPGSALGVNRMELDFDSSMSTSVNGNTATVGINPDLLSSYAYQSSVSSKLDESAFTAYTSTATSFTGVTTDATLTGDGTVGSALGVVRMELNFESSLITSVNGNTASVGVNTAILSAYAFNSALSSKLDASASASFQPSGNYQPSGDYAYNSALTAYQPVSGMTAYAPSGDYADNSALGLKQDASAMTAYQEVSGMTAYQPAGDYQPSGDYIYASSLGIMEI